MKKSHLSEWIMIFGPIDPMFVIEKAITNTDKVQIGLQNQRFGDKPIMVWRQRPF